MLGTTTTRFEDWDQLPLFMTIRQTEPVLQLGRTTIYGLTVEWEASGGKSGLPFVWFGGQKRIPREVLRDVVRRLNGGIAS